MRMFQTLRHPKPEPGSTVVGGHAFHAEVVDPKSGETITLVAATPEELEQALDRLGDVDET